MMFLSPTPDESSGPAESNIAWALRLPRAPAPSPEVAQRCYAALRDAASAGTASTLYDHVLVGILWNGPMKGHATRTLGVRELEVATLKELFHPTSGLTEEQRDGHVRGQLGVLTLREPGQEREAIRLLEGALQRFTAVGDHEAALNYGRQIGTALREANDLDGAEAVFEGLLRRHAGPLLAAMRETPPAAQHHDELWLPRAVQADLGRVYHLRALQSPANQRESLFDQAAIEFELAETNIHQDGDRKAIEWDSGLLCGLPGVYYNLFLIDEALHSADGDLLHTLDDVLHRAQVDQSANAPERRNSVINVQLARLVEGLARIGLGENRVGNAILDDARAFFLRDPGRAPRLRELQIDRLQRALTAAAQGRGSRTPRA